MHTWIFKKTAEMRNANRCARTNLSNYQVTLASPNVALASLVLAEMHILWVWRHGNLEVRDVPGVLLLAARFLNINFAIMHRAPPIFPLARVKTYPHKMKAQLVAYHQELQGIPGKHLCYHMLRDHWRRKNQGKQRRACSRDSSCLKFN